MTASSICSQLGIDGGTDDIDVPRSSQQWHLFSHELSHPSLKPNGYENLQDFSLLSSLGRSLKGRGALLARSPRLRSQNVSAPVTEMFLCACACNGFGIAP
ncbi:hypothetical protein M408DRAFT_239470 [Serendipita vermifera MAFF 305830]|uniref:Uncharacterized protein n=1 Tax=Serendipita vermifera MAFF 305830 TaxID=933852 RepID=A0A0C2X0N4_SERVB|nr:hypothetical protein M408DRAFT_239470 [Serendipita vermifera MAFF 305830]